VGTVIGWDHYNELPIFDQALGILDLPEGIALARQSITLDSVTGLRLEALYEASDSATLVVSFHGAQDRSKVVTPRFEWRRTLSRIEAGRLYLADATLELSKNLEIGWYVGSREINLIEACARHVQGVAEKGAYSRIVCIGASAGGFAAMAVSRLVPGSVAVAFSPQTAISAYHTPARNMLGAVVFPNGPHFSEIENDNVSRMNMRRFYSNTPNVNYLHYVQNLNDEFHYSAHYAPFALAQCVDPEIGGIDLSGQYNFVVEHHQFGHAPPSRRCFLDHLQQAHENYFGVGLESRPRDLAAERLLGER